MRQKIIKHILFFFKKKNQKTKNKKTDSTALLAFILFRQHHQAAVVAQYPDKPNPEISKVIGQMWKTSGDHVKAIWQSHADVGSTYAISFVVEHIARVLLTCNFIGRETAAFAEVSTVSISASPDQQKERFGGIADASNRIRYMPQLRRSNRSSPHLSEPEGGSICSEIPPARRAKPTLRRSPEKHGKPRWSGFPQEWRRRRRWGGASWNRGIATAWPTEWGR